MYNTLRTFLFRYKTALPFALLLLALLWRNPFSVRTLIPNFEPYPDSFHYIVPIRSLLQGHGLLIWREGRGFIPNVPPLYSLALAPMFVIRNDPRMFYYMNVLLSFVAFGLFVAIVRKLFDSEMIRVPLYLLYVTNFYMSWYPEWVMSDNLTLPLILLATYLLVMPATKWKAFFAALLPVMFYETKFAHAPLVGVTVILFAIKYVLPVLRKKTSAKSVKAIAKIFAISAAIAGIFFTFGDLLLSGRNIYITVWQFGMSYLQQGLGKLAPPTPATSVQTNTTVWFSLDFIPLHFAKYLSGLLGQKTVVLWESTPILPNVFAIFGAIGLGIGLIQRKTRFIAFCMASLILGETLFMSTFYAVDLRYVMYAIPFLILGVGFVLEYVMQTVFQRKEMLFTALMTIIFLVYFATIAWGLKAKIMLNLKYAETPWWYISTQELNIYMDSLPKQAKKPVVVSTIPPYFFDYYTADRYILLPLSGAQDFWPNKEKAWGDHDYSDLHALYRNYIDQGYDVYVEKYGLGNVQVFHQDFDALAKDFAVIERKDACYTQCTIYQLEKK